MAASHITDFIQSLNSEELKCVKKHIYSENKLTKLLTILTENPEKNFSDQELGKLLDTSTTAIRVLKSKLFGIIKEKLLTDEHLENENLFNEREIAVFKLRKQMVFVVRRQTNLDFS